VILPVLGIQALPARKQFFFEKKNQKTFTHDHIVNG